MNKDQVCSRCRFWVSAHELGLRGIWSGLKGRSRRAKRGQCHRHAPRAKSLSPQWPWTKADDSCGEFEPRLDEHRPLEEASARSPEDPLAVP